MNFTSDAVAVGVLDAVRESLNAGNSNCHDPPGTFDGHGEARSRRPW
jgi:hypothetical protein